MIDLGLLLNGRLKIIVRSILENNTAGTLGIG